MGKMWQEMGPNNGAPRGDEGERLWVSEKTEPVLSNPNQATINKKYQNSSFPEKLTCPLAQLKSFFTLVQIGWDTFNIIGPILTPIEFS